MSKPSIVVVPGAHHVPQHFQAVTDILQRDGHRIVGVTLPVPGDSMWKDGYQGYLSAIRSVLEQEIRAGHDVLLVLHSASGITGSAAMKGLAKLPNNSQPGVIRILAISAILARPGQDPLYALYGRASQWREIKNDRFVVLPFEEPNPQPMVPGIIKVSPAVALYNDMTSKQQHEAYALLVPTPLDILSVRPEYAGWQDVPMTYIVCEKDMAIDPGIQWEMIRGTNVEVEIRTLNASHSPFLSVPEQVAEMVRAAADM